MKVDSLERDRSLEEFEIRTGRLEAEVNRLNNEIIKMDNYEIENHAIVVEKRMEERTENQVKFIDDFNNQVLKEKNSKKLNEIVEAHCKI